VNKHGGKEQIFCNDDGMLNIVNWSYTKTYSKELVQLQNKFLLHYYLWTKVGQI